MQKTKHRRRIAGFGAALAPILSAALFWLHSSDLIFIFIQIYLKRASVGILFALH